MAIKYHQKQTLIIKAILVSLLGVMCGISMLFASDIEKALNIGNYTYGDKAQYEVVSNGNLVVYYIDVGQGDSTLIKLPDGTTMLIDAGTANETKSKELVDFIKNEANVDKINYLVLTHSDSDHSGGMAEILQNFEVQKIYRPFQLACKSAVNASGSVYPGLPIEEEDLRQYYIESEDANDWFTSQVVNTSYSNFIKGAYSETWTNDDGSVSNAVVTVSHEGLLIESVDNLEYFKIEFFAPQVISSKILIGAYKTLGRPVKKYSNTNNYSPIMLLSYLNNSFVFSGDAEKEVENDFYSTYAENQSVLEQFKNVSVYKAGHHGSSTSSTEEFLKMINPTYTVVSCGFNNIYGHPSTAFLNRWENQMVTQGTNRRQTEPFVTAKNSTIVFAVLENGDLEYYLGLARVTKAYYWGYFALAIFVVGTIIIIRIKIYIKPKKSANLDYIPEKIDKNL